jgi:two-component system, NarL family, invasion response regulator UvrY
MTTQLSTTRIAVADNCPSVCRGLRSLLGETSDLRVQGEARDEPQLLKLLRKEPFEFLILEIHLEGADRALPLLHRILEFFPRTKVLVYTGDDSTHVILRALKSGAAGYLLKRCDEREIISAIRTIRAGSKYVAHVLAQKLALLHCSVDKRRLDLEHLSNREFDVFKALASGKPLVQIAREACLSPKTITTYRARVLEKLGLSSNADLIRVAVQHAPYLFADVTRQDPLTRAVAQ